MTQELVEDDIRTLHIRGEFDRDFRDLEDVIRIAKRKAKNLFNLYATYDVLVREVKHSDLGGFNVTLVCRHRANLE